jgi:phosphatidate cytidylyltransferase
LSSGNLTQRFITAIAGIAIILAGILFNELTCLVLIFFIATISLIEFYRLAKNDQLQPQTGAGLALNALIFLPVLLDRIELISINLLPLLIIFPYFIFIRELYTKSEKPFNNIAITILGNVYISIPMFLFYLISFHGTGEHEYHPEYLLGYLFILWACDTGGYFGGRFFGKHKMFERISPKKTWEGFAGGAMLGVITAIIVSRFYTSLPLEQWIIVSIIIFISSVLGDLIESMFKRSIQVKDSGSVLPGHGGFLDRFDGLFISAPFVFFWLEGFAVNS